MSKPKSAWVTVKRPSKVKDQALYFIQRHGGYFRPEAKGYASDLADAGTFIGSEAKKYLEVEGVTLHPVKPLLQVLVKEMQTHARRALALAMLVEKF